MGKQAKPLISLEEFAKTNRPVGTCQVCRSPLRGEIERGFTKQYGASFIAKWLRMAYPDCGITRSMIEHHLRSAHASRVK